MVEPYPIARKDSIEAWRMGTLAGKTEDAKQLLIAMAFENVKVLAQLSILSEVLRSLFKAKE
jgi:hypothetical protein